MSMVRDAILKHAKESGLTVYQVAKMLEGRVPQRTVYAFFSGERDAGSKTVSEIMDVLGLTVAKKKMGAKK